MLIYNKKFSVSPITTHLPVKDPKSLSKLKLRKSAASKYFYKTILKKFKAAILGLNPL